MSSAVVVVVAVAVADADRVVVPPGADVTVTVFGGVTKAVGGDVCCCAVMLFTVLISSGCVGSL